MAIYRGTGGSGSSTTDSYASEISDYAQTAIDKAQEASDSAAAAALSKTQANDSATLSSGSATAADNARIAAQAARDAAQTAEDNAGFSSDDAEKLAINPEDSQFTLSDGFTTGYSALHHKEKAIDAQSSAEGARDTALTYSDNALSYRNTTLGYRDAAEGHANTATTQAGIATTQAGTATTQAGAATTQAGIATTQAGIATDKASEAAASANSAAASYDSFDDRYLGSKASDPTVDNDGDALLTGALYFNSTTDAMKVYDGASWVAAYASIAGITLDDVTNDGNTTTNAITVGGMTSTGAVILNADPSSNLGAATKQYVDTIAAAGVHYHDPVRVEQEGNLAATYDNGSSGVGATLTNSGVQEALVIDGVTLLSEDRVLIYEQTNEAHNGVYTVTDVGSGSTNWVLTRAADADSYAPSDPDSFGQGDAFYVQEGLMGAGETYVMTTEGAITFGTTNIHFSQISSAQVYSGGAGIDVTGTTISSTATLANVTTAGNSTTNSITVGGITSTGLITASNLNTSDWDTAYGWGDHGGAGYYVNGSAGFNSTGIDDNATSTAITIDANENVGISTSPYSWGAGFPAIDLGDLISFSSSSTSTYSTTNAYFDGTAWRAKVDGYAALCGVDLTANTDYALYSSSSVLAGEPIIFGRRGITTDITSGNVGIGTTSPSTNLGAYSGLSIAGSNAGLQLQGSSFSTILFGDAADADVGQLAYDHSQNALRVFTNASERMRIDSSGNVGIGTSSPTSSGSTYKALHVNGTNGGQLHLTNTTDGTTVSDGLLISQLAARAIINQQENGPLEFRTNNTEAMRITSSGNVGIGNSPVNAKMYIKGVNNQGAPSTSIDSTLTLMTGTGGVGSGGELRFAALDNPAGQAAIKSYATDGGGFSQGYLDFYIRPSITSTSMTLGMRLGHQGSLTVTGNVTAYSDERLKDNVETLDGSKVYEMRGVSFTKDGEAGSGVIAQELQKVAPELVHEGEEYLSVAYGNLVGYLIEAVKDLKAEVEVLKEAK